MYLQAYFLNRTGIACCRSELARYRDGLAVLFHALFPALERITRTLTNTHSQHPRKHVDLPHSEANLYIFFTDLVILLTAFSRRWWRIGSESKTQQSWLGTTDSLLL